MTPETRQVALEKLAAFHPKIGYPERWRDYSGLSIVRGDAFGNLTRARVFEWQRQVRRLKEPTDRGETDFPICDQDLEAADSEQGIRTARRHRRRMLLQGIQSGNRGLELRGSARRVL